MSSVARLDQHFISQGTTYLYSSFQGYIILVSLLFPLICPLKVVHADLCINDGVKEDADENEQESCNRN